MTESMILENYDLGGVDCPYCRNSGMVTRVGEDGALYSRECRCMKKRWIDRHASLALTG